MNQSWLIDSSCHDGRYVNEEKGDCVSCRVVSACAWSVFPLSSLAPPPHSEIRLLVAPSSDIKLCRLVLSCRVIWGTGGWRRQRLISSSDYLLRVGACSLMPLSLFIGSVPTWLNIRHCGNDADAQRHVCTHAALLVALAWIIVWFNLLLWPLLTTSRCFFRALLRKHECPDGVIVLFFCWFCARANLKKRRRRRRRRNGGMAAAVVLSISLSASSSSSSSSSTLIGYNNVDLS